MDMRASVETPMANMESQWNVNVIRYVRVTLQKYAEEFGEIASTQQVCMSYSSTPAHLFFIMQNACG